MAVLKFKDGGDLYAVGGPGTPQPGASVTADQPNTFTADQTFTANLLPVGTGGNSVRIGSTAQANVSGASAIGIGTSAQATSASVIAIGQSAVASGTLAVAIGASSVASGANRCVAVGRFAQATGTSSTAIGGDTQAAAGSSIAIGYQASVVSTITGGMAIGNGATVTQASFSSPAMAVGYQAQAADGRACAVGPQARALGISSTAIGRGAIAEGTHAIAIGRGAWADSDNSIAIGFSGGAGTTDVYFESGHTHKYDDPIDGSTITRAPSTTVIAIHGFDAYDATASPTNNVAGGPLHLVGGRGTGTAAGGAVKLQVAPAGGVSNNVKNTTVTVVEAAAGAAGGTLGFYGATPVAKQTGVAVTAAGVHAALVALGLIAA